MVAHPLQLVLFYFWTLPSETDLTGSGTPLKRHRTSSEAASQPARAGDKGMSSSRPFSMVPTKVPKANILCPSSHALDMVLQMKSIALVL